MVVLSRVMDYKKILIYFIFLEDSSAKEDPTNSLQSLKVSPYKRGYSHPPLIMKQLSLIREESSTGCDVTDDCTVETGLLPAKIKLENTSSTNNDSDFNPDEIIQILVMESERKSLDNPTQSELKSLLDNNNIQSQAGTNNSEIRENTNLPGDHKSAGSSNQSSANSSPKTGFKPRTSIRRSFKERSDIMRLSRDKRRRRCASETCEISAINAALAEVHKKESKKRLSLPNMPHLRRGSMSSSSSSSSILSRYKQFENIKFSVIFNKNCL